MSETFDSIAEWQQRTFPNATPLGALAHMEKEIEEIEDCHRYGSDDEVKEELADVFILWVAACDRFGFGSEEMQHYIDAKRIAEKKRAKCQHCGRMTEVRLDLTIREIQEEQHGH